jgi:hypothetical protein
MDRQVAALVMHRQRGTRFLRKRSDESYFSLGDGAGALRKRPNQSHFFPSTVVCFFQSSVFRFPFSVAGGGWPGSGWNRVIERRRSISSKRLGRSIMSTVAKWQRSPSRKLQSSAIGCNLRCRRGLRARARWTLARWRSHAGALSAASLRRPAGGNSPETPRTRRPNDPSPKRPRVDSGGVPFTRSRAGLAWLRLASWVTGFLPVALRTTSPLPGPEQRLELLLAGAVP